VLRDIRDETRDATDGATVVIVDDRRTRIDVSTAFGGTIDNAVLLESHRRRIWLIEAA
jgi:hypothetical protein